MASLPEGSHSPEEVNVGAGEPRPPGMNADEDIKLEGPFVEGRNYMGTTIFGNNGEPIQTITYEAISFRGCGSFGSVFQARIVETGDIVAIKRVKQMEGYTHYHDHELEMMRKMNHQNVVSLNRCFYSISIRDELFINFVMEYVPSTLNRVLNLCKTANWRMPLIYVKLFMYQIFRGLAYIHNVHGVTHRDLKTRNILVNPLTHQVKLCDFGSATILVGEEPHQSYIGCRHERAPELVFGATQYTSSVDIWSAGCVLGELLLGEPLFPGNNRDRRFEIIKVLGTPTREEIHRMNPNLTNVRFPQIKAQPWHKIFHSRMPRAAIDLVSKLLQYSPNLRCTALEACAHPFFDELRQPNARLPLGQPLPQLFNFTQELTGASPELISKLIPEHVRRQSDLNIQQNTGE